MEMPFLSDRLELLELDQTFMLCDLLQEFLLATDLQRGYEIYDTVRQRALRIGGCLEENRSLCYTPCVT